MITPVTELVVESDNAQDTQLPEYGAVDDKYQPLIQVKSPFAALVPAYVHDKATPLFVAPLKHAKH